ncbi:MAG: PQQ-like beta-propeller repeat protein [Acidobacteria bacterium]|nr:PQQ-like beta-propeller repeat protein [Acidobacteriota bacterium]
MQDRVKKIILNNHLRAWSFIICLIAIVGAMTVSAQRRPRPATKQPAKASPTPQPPQLQSWLQWGGPNRNFKVTAEGLKDSWPADGPRRLWGRALGQGHSAILFDNGRLYTSYSNGDRETIISLDAATGKTLWEFPYEARTAGLNLGEGNGPHSTPLIVGNTIYAVGVMGTMHALDKMNGRMLWKRDLWSELKGYLDDRGYSPSPIAYKNTVIVPVGGGSGQCLIAFDQRTGNIVWKNLNFTPAPASPILIDVSGQEQLIGFGTNEIFGADPNNGNLLWSHPHKTDYGLNISTPVWGPDNLLFMSSSYGTGSRVLELKRDGNQTSVRQVWADKRMRVHIGTVVRIGDLAYGSSGEGPAFFTAVNVKSGQIAWQERGLARASFVNADDKLIILDEDGTLALAKPMMNSLNILSKTSVMQNIAWTVPTLVGTKLFLRDRRAIMALDLG